MFRNLMISDAVSQHNKEWKPKSSQKANNSPGVIGTPKKTVSPAQDSENVESEAAKLTDNLSKVTIAQHISVAETDRLRLTFGTLGVGAKLDFLGRQAKYNFDGATEKSSGELTTRLAFLFCSLFKLNFLIVCQKVNDFEGIATPFRLAVYFELPLRFALFLVLLKFVLFFATDIFLV